jgi:tetratricopeptide (TPR) repeat protein
MRLVPFALVAAIGAGCAARARPAPPPSVDLAAADVLFEAGCYRCLLQASAVYERAAAMQPAPAAARPRAFETAVLLALREKELGLAAVPWLDRASTLASIDERRYVDVVAKLPWASAGAAADFEPTVRLTEAAAAEWSAAPASGAHPLLDQYLRVTLSCTVGRRGALEEILGQIDLARPPLRYRVGLCGLGYRDHLDAVVAADSRYAEAQFSIGRYEMAAGVTPGIARGRSREWLTRAVPPLVAAHDGLPESPIVTTVLAGLMRSRTELGRALSLYDEALTIRPTQADALLGRVITLSYLGRRDDAIASATRLIDQGRWYVGAGYYWRGWNNYYAGRLEAAASDVAAARRLMIDEDVMALAGMVAYDQKRPADARADFTSALGMNPAKCLATWYLGLLDVDDQAWAAAMPRFVAAGSCYQREADAARAEIDQLPVDLPEDARQSQIAAINGTVTTSLQQAGRAFFNAAQAALRLDDRAAAGRFAQSAVKYENVRARAEALLESLERPLQQQ